MLPWQDQSHFIGPALHISEDSFWGLQIYMVLVSLIAEERTSFLIFLSSKVLGKILTNVASNMHSALHKSLALQV